ncbi:MAG: TIGR03546 family protein [Endomicrobiales bacterium]|nr:TIGR03546 family protein [Endomicrobiales bacterium]
MIWIKFVKKLIKILNSEISPNQIAWGFALGAIMGFIPTGSLLSVCVLIIIFLVNVNISSAFLGFAVFKIISILTDPIAHKIGYSLLITNSSLTSLWTSIYNMPIIPFTKFNNTVVMGNIILSIILIVPIYFGFKKFIVFYRTSLQQKVVNWKIVKWFKLSKVYSIYDKYR